MVSRARSLTALGVAVAVFGATAIALSCLPDLAELPPVLVDPGPPNGNPCGDGVIDIEAGEQCDPGFADAGAQCTGTCTVVCEGGLYDDTSGHCYMYAAPGVDYSTAKSKCELLGGHVASFASEDEYTTVSAWYPQSDAGLWIGLAFDDTSLAFVTQRGREPGWLNDGRCSGCYAHLDAGADAFPEYPVPGLKACVAALPKLPKVPWFLFPCYIPLGVVCEREPLGSYAQACLGGTCIVLKKTFATKRYLYVPTAETAINAQRSCRQNGGMLAVLESREEREQLGAELARSFPMASPPEVWVGLTRQSTTAPWIWENEASVDGPYPVPWGDREPTVQPQAKDGLYTKMNLLPGSYDTQLLHTADGTQLLTYVCEFPREPAR